jgi:RNA polymerase sigma-70 factor (ECF subfamily)
MKIDEGFRAMYEREFPSVYRAVYVLCRDPSLAEEAAQEAFARALARWRRLRRHPSVAGWITTTALNVARRSLRKRELLHAPPPAEPDREARMDLASGIRRLPARQQEAVLLYYLLDLSVAQTAAAMEVDPGTVKTHLSRARIALAESLAVDDDPLDPRSHDHA